MNWKRCVRVSMITLFLFALKLLIPSKSLVQTALAQQTNTPSVFYDFEIIATTGQAGLTGIEDGPSVNDKGTVAFVGKLATGIGSQAVFVGGLPAPSNSVRQISSGFIAPNHRFDRFVQINNNDKVVAQDFEGDAGGQHTRIRVYDLATGNESVIASGLANNPLIDFEAVLGHTSINNRDQVVFSALSGRGTLASECPDRCLVTPNVPNGFNAEPLPLAQQNVLPHPLIADNGRIVVQAGGSITSPIRLYDNNLNPNNFDEIASANDFDRLGQSPGISDNGEVVAFYGELNAAGAARLSATTGPGIFVWIAASGDIVRITGQQVEDTSASGGNGDGICDLNETCQPAPELGYNDAGKPLYLGAYDIDSRVAVIHQEFGPDIEDDNFVVSFIATPNEPSRNNPQTGKPFTFSDKKGLWSVIVDIDLSLGSTPQQVLYHPTSPLPVAQIDDVIGHHQITDLAVYNQLAKASTGQCNGTQTQQRGDHSVVFKASTLGGDVLIRATHLDSDGDGLLNHWEEMGGGIDADGNGRIDLDLHAMGADLCHRDLFLEIDWLAKRGNLNFAPQAEAIDFLVKMFANSPGGGIKLHVDAGRGPKMSPNMGSDQHVLQGGDRIRAWQNGPHIDFVYFGVNRNLSLAGTARSFEDIKDNFFGTADNRAREFAFHYVLFADKAYDPNNPNRTPSGVAEITWRSTHDLHTVPGNDVIVALQGTPHVQPLPTGFYQAQALAHELGHNLGLNHSPVGLDSSNPPVHPNYNRLEYRPNHVSLMNYAYYFGLYHPVLTATVTTLTADTVRYDPPFSGVGGSANLSGLDVLITAGKGFSQTNIIHSNTDSQLTVVNPWITIPDSTSRFAVLYRDYSSSSPFNDWDHIKLDFQNYMNFLGNSFDLKAPGTSVFAQPEPDIKVLESIVGPFDYEVPSIVISSPTSNEVIPIGSDLAVTFTVTDDLGIDSIEATFDANGDGTVNALEEAYLAPSTGPELYEVTFETVSGPRGLRTIEVSATDLSGRTGVASTTVTIEGGAGLDITRPLVSIDSPMLGTLMPIGDDLAITLTVTDDVAVDSVTVSFDVDGNGAIDDSNEITQATRTEPDTYEAVFVSIGGPGGPRTVSVSAEDTSGNVGVVNTTVTVGDSTGGTTAPLVTINTPPSGMLMPLHSDLAVRLSTTSQEDITAVTVLFDTDGNGLINRFGEFVRAEKRNGDTYEATFNNLSGPVGARLLRVFATDAALNIGAAAATVMVGDTTEPSVSIEWPTPGMLIPVGNDLTISFRATDDVDVDSVTVTFDTNGDNVIDDSSEIITPTSTGPGMYEANLINVSGAEGRRTVRISAQDPSLNVGIANRVVTVGDSVPIVGLGTSVPYEMVYGMGGITSIAYSPNGEKALVGGKHGFAMLVDLGTGNVEGHFIGYSLGSDIEVTAVAFSPVANSSDEDGWLVATGSSDGMARLWNTTDGKLLHVFSQGKNRVTSIAFSPVSDHLVTGSGHTAWLWNGKDGRQICPFSGHTGEVHTVAFNHNGSLVLTGSADHTARLWDGSNCDLLGTFSHSNTEEVKTVRFSPDTKSKLILTATSGNTAYIWNVESHEREILPHPGPVTSATFSSDSKLAATGSGSSVYLFDIKERQPVHEPIHTFEGHSGQVNALAFSPVEGSFNMLTGGDDGSVRLWDAASIMEPSTVAGHEGQVRVIEVGAETDGTQLILTGGADRTARLWTVENGELSNSVTVTETQSIVAVAISPDGKQILTGGDNTIGLWDVQTATEITRTTAPPSELRALAFSQDGSQILIGSKDGTISLWNWQATTPKPIIPLTPTIPGGDITALAFSQDGTTVIVGFADGSARAGTIATDGLTLGPPLTGYAGYRRQVTSTALSSDGSWALTRHWDNKALLWDTTAGGWRTFVAPRPDPYSGIIWALSPDGSRLASAHGREVRLWDTATGDQLRVIREPEHSGPVSALAFSADGTQLITVGKNGWVRLRNAIAGSTLRVYRGDYPSALPSNTVVYSQDGSMRLTVRGAEVVLWDVATNTIRHSALVPGDNNKIRTVAFSHNGTKIVTGSQNGVHVWEWKAGTLEQLPGYSRWVNSVAFSPTNTHVLAGVQDNEALLWEVSDESDLIPTILSHDGEVKAVAFSSDGSRILTGSSEGAAKLWTPEEPHEPLQVFKYGIRNAGGNINPVPFTSVAFSPNNEQVLTGHNDRRVRLWDVATGTLLRAYEDGISSDGSGERLAAFSTDGRNIVVRVVSGPWEITRLWKLAATATPPRSLPEQYTSRDGTIVASEWLPSGDELVTLGCRGARLWSVDKTLLHSLFEDRNNTNCSSGRVAFSPASSYEGSYILTWVNTGNLEMWDALTGQNLSQEPAEAIRAITSSADGFWMATGSINNELRLHWWDEESRNWRHLKTFTGYSNNINEMAFSPDGRQILVGSEDDFHARLWDLDSEGVITFTGHTDAVTAVAFSSDGTQVLTGSKDKTVRLWDMATGTLLHIYNHPYPVKTVAFVPNQPWIVTTGDGSHTAYIWNIEDGGLVFAVSHLGDINTAVFSPDGTQLLTGGSDGTARLWMIEE